MTTTPEAPAWKIGGDGRWRSVQVGGWSVEDVDELTPDGATRAPLRFWGPESENGQTMLEGVEAARECARGLLAAADYAERHMLD